LKDLSSILLNLRMSIIRYIRLERFAADKHFSLVSLVDQFVSYEENEVL